MAITNELDVLKQRITRLERRNRMILVVAGLALAAAAPLALMAQMPAARVVEAQQFILADTDGKMRATLEMAGSGPALTLRDADGTIKVRLAIGLKGPTLSAIMPSGKTIDLLSESRTLPLSDRR